VVLMLGFGLGASLTYGAQQDGVAAALGDLVPAALSPLPAVWVVSAVGLLLFGLRARWATLGWAVLAACLLLGQVGELLGLPGWVVGLSPYGHLPRLPAESFVSAGARAHGDRGGAAGAGRVAVPGARRRLRAASVDLAGRRQRDLLDDQPDPWHVARGRAGSGPAPAAPVARRRR
jgi:hypothetical protein